MNRGRHDVVLSLFGAFPKARRDEPPRPQVRPRAHTRDEPSSSEIARLRARTAVAFPAGMTKLALPAIFLAFCLAGLAGLADLAGPPGTEGVAARVEGPR